MNGVSSYFSHHGPRAAVQYVHSGLQVIFSEDLLIKCAPLI